MNFDFDVGGPLTFLRGERNVSMDQIETDSNSVPLTLAMSSFGEWFFTNPRSPERALCNPKVWINENMPSQFTEWDLQHLEHSALMVARPEIVAEYFIPKKGRELEYVDFVLGNKIARDHMFAIASDLEHEERLDQARVLILTEEARRAARASLRDLGL
jgi:hypothetical protein